MGDNGQFHTLRDMRTEEGKRNAESEGNHKDRTREEKGGSGMNQNGYPVQGVLHMLSSGSSTISQTEEIINMYIELSTRKGYVEGVTDTLRSNAKRLYKSEKPYQSLLDMEPV